MLTGPEGVKIPIYDPACGRPQKIGEFSMQFTKSQLNNKRTGLSNKGILKKKDKKLPSHKTSFKAFDFEDSPLPKRTPTTGTKRKKKRKRAGEEEEEGGESDDVVEIFDDGYSSPPDVQTPDPSKKKTKGLVNSNQVDQKVQMLDVKKGEKRKEGFPFPMTKLLDQSSGYGIYKFGDYFPFVTYSVEDDGEIPKIIATMEIDPFTEDNLPDRAKENLKSPLDSVQIMTKKDVLCKQKQLYVEYELEVPYKEAREFEVFKNEEDEEVFGKDHHYYVDFKFKGNLQKTPKQPKKKRKVMGRSKSGGRNILE